MCLSTLSLNMHYDEKENAFVGIGYKSISILDRNGNVNWSISKFLKPNVWLEASGDFDKVLPERERFNLSEFTEYGGKPYWPGFHIFLDVKHAIGYCGVSQLVEVKFKEVTCFGKNNTSRNISEIQANCVIARYAKITKILSRKAEYYTKTNGKYPEPYRIYED